MLGLSPKQMSLIWFLWAAAICRAVVSVLLGKKMVPQAGMDKGHTATAGTPKDYGCSSHREAGALWLCGNQFQLLCSWLAFWLASTVCKYLQEKQRVGPKSGSGKSGHGMLKLACWEFQRLSCGTTWCWISQVFSRRGNRRRKRTSLLPAWHVHRSLSRDSGVIWPVSLAEFLPLICFPLSTPTLAALL